MNFIDSHIHLVDEQYREDLDQILSTLRDHGVLYCVHPGCDLESSIFAVDLAHSKEAIYACVGSHPHEAKYYDLFTEKQYRDLAREEKKVVAIGEIGLDYHYDFSPREKQKLVFQKQLDLARELDLPVVIHCREAAEDCYRIVKDYHDLKILMHSFNEEEKWQDLFLELGVSFSISGMVTFKNNQYVPELVEKAPLEKLLAETDGPYLAPIPFRGKRNLPWYTKYVIEKIAEIKGLSFEEVAQVTRDNAIDFFCLKEVQE